MEWPAGGPSWPNVAATRCWGVGLVNPTSWACADDSKRSLSCLQAGMVDAVSKSKIGFEQKYRSRLGFCNCMFRQTSRSVHSKRMNLKLCLSLKAHQGACRPCSPSSIYSCCSCGLRLIRAINLKYRSAAAYATVGLEVARTCRWIKDENQ